MQAKDRKGIDVRSHGTTLLPAIGRLFPRNFRCGKALPSKPAASVSASVYVCCPSEAQYTFLNTGRRGHHAMVTSE